VVLWASRSFCNFLQRRLSFEVLQILNMRFSAVLIEQEGVGVKKVNGLVGRHRILPLLVMSMAISACNTKAPADLIESADGYLKKGDIK
ncbi:hypothetical protein, partial [Enterobacter hormaechei]